MDREKIAIFEELNSSFYPLVRKYLNNGFTIYFFQIDASLKGKRVITEYLKSERMIDISGIIFEYLLLRRAPFYAHENVDRIFEKYYSHSPSIKNMSNLLKYPEMENMYKERLLTRLQQVYDIELKICEIVKSHNTGEVHFYPSNNFKIHLDESSLLKDNIKIIRNNSLKNTLKRVLSRSKKELFVVGLPIYLFLTRVRGISGNKNPREFKVGITIKHPQYLFSMNYYGDNIFIDDEELPKENVLFIDESGPLLNKTEYEKRGYNYFSLSDMKEVISTNLFWKKMVKCLIPAWFKAILLSLWEETLIVDTTRTILADYIIWNIFADNYKINNYVKRLLPDTISKMLILSQYDIRTWIIHTDNYTGYYHTGWDETMRVQTVYSSMHYDCAVVYGDKVRRYLVNHRNYIKEYVMTGVFFSQIVRELQEGKLESPISDIVRKKGLPGKLIGVFDTSFVDRGPVKERDGIRFGNDILRLLDEFPDIGVIFKAKKELELTPFLISIYEKLKDHERCIFLARYDKEGVSAPEVIAQSDLVISAAYTSTTAEALGARKRAIYYDVAGHDIGDKYYFNNFPNFVAHSYEELKQLIHYWMYEVTDKEFDDFLNTYVKDEIDPYLDGKALSRFRNLLMKV